MKVKNDRQKSRTSAWIADLGDGNGCASTTIEWSSGPYGPLLKANSGSGGDHLYAAWSAFQLRGRIGIRLLSLSLLVAVTVSATIGANCARGAKYRVAQKVSHSQMIKNRIKSYQSLSVRSDLFVKLKYESNTIILLVGIRYFMRYLLSDLNNYAWPAN